jgi:hypothetical protein
MNPMNNQNETVELAIVVDATGSMSSTLASLKPSLTQLCRLLPLFVKARFHLIIYRDFDCKAADVYQHHGPFEATDISQMLNVISNTGPIGGGDSEECQKVAFNRFLEDVPTGKRILFHFTDAAPHRFPFPAKGSDNHYKEGHNLKVNGWIQDWVPLCQKYKELEIPVYTIGVIGGESLKYYSLMSEMTGGDVVLLRDNQVDTILKATTIVFPRALGYDEYNLVNLASLIRMTDPSNIPSTEDCNDFRNMKTIVLTFSNDGQTHELKKAFDVCTRQKLEHRYKNDADFQASCFNTFVSMVKEGNILAITYNPLLGSLYRNMCRRSKIAQLEARRDELTNLISTTMNSLKSTNKPVYDQVSTWIENSYNRIDEINELIMTMNAPMVPFFSLQTVERMTKKELTLCCKIPMPQNLRMLGNLISSVTLVDKKPKTMPEVFVPVGVSDAELFSLLSHLMCPGVRIDFRPSIVVALVALNCNNAYLADRALNFLRESRGKWFGKDESEWHLFGIIKLILKLEAQYGGIITQDEMAYMLPLFRISAIKYNNCEMNWKRKFRLAPEHGKRYHDHKVQCSKCMQYRSASVMTPKGCGLCLSYTPVELANLTDPDKTHSYLFNCTVCDSQYAVRNLDGLNTKPKCHFCRMVPPMPKDEIPKVVCTVCDVGMILPDDTTVSTGNFMCALCAENGGEERIETMTYRVHDILRANPDLVPALINIKMDFNLLTGRDSLFAIKGKYEVLSDSTPPMVYADRLMYDGRKLLNGAELINEMMEIVRFGKVNMESCSICYNDFTHHELDNMCYNKKCIAKGCHTCIKKWFSENAPGKQVLENRTQCPSCKQNPRKGLAFTNPHLRELLAQHVEFSPDWHYASCASCHKIKEYMMRECIGVDPMEITDYTCEDCMKPSGLFKNCPGCGIKVSKSSGCDHMICPKEMGGCGLHWCFRCVEPDVFHSNDSTDVYNHMYEAHKNIYGVADEGEYDTDDDY